MDDTNHTGGKDEEAENSGAAVPPPALFAGGLALGLGLSKVAGAERGPAIARGLGAASIVAGILIGGATLLALKRAGTSPNPYEPATALVTDGVFQVTRNPAYVGATFIYIGAAMYARSIPAFVTLPIVLALLDHFVVDREERYLERRFGDDYRRYHAAVPRWF